MDREKEKLKTSKISLTVRSRIWEVFAENCYRAGMTPSRVLEIFMLCMIDPYPANRLEKFLMVTKGLKDIYESMLKDTELKPSPGDKRNGEGHVESGGKIDARTD